MKTTFSALLLEPLAPSEEPEPESVSALPQAVRASARERVATRELLCAG